MLFILGNITGILISAIIFVILAFFRAGIEKRIKIIETQLAQAGPKPTGAIFIPEDEAEQARQAHIKKNAKHGRPTFLSELKDGE